MKKAIIVDDNPIERKILLDALEKIAHNLEIKGMADNIADGLTLIETHNPDLVFLDVQIPPHTGFDLLQQVPKINFQTIFVTSYDQYAIRAIKFNALDYLLKPVLAEELQEALDKFENAQKEIKKDDRIDQFLLYLQKKEGISRIVVPVSDGFDVLDVEDILYCEADRSYCHLYLKNGKKILVSKPLRHFEELLVEDQFRRIHQSYVVSLKHIVKFIRGKDYQVKMSNDVILPISRNSKSSLLKEFL